MIRLRPEVARQSVDGLEGLKRSLQSAIELEHATIPPYLYALYSIRPGTNQRLAEIIRSIALEEMLHLSLGCNLLNAIGGEPSLDRPDFIATYPGPLPGAVAEIEVPLAPVSKALIRDVFMEIEEPEDPLAFPVAAAREAEGPPVTIGQFYEAIKSQMELLASQGDLFTGDPSRQLTFGLPELISVTDLESAKEAIDLIVEQGEGTPLSPLAPDQEPAHYYLFAAAYHGRELVPQQGTPPFAYAGDPIPFEEEEIIPLMTNPSPDRYAGTPAAALNEQFNKTYTKVLKALQSGFDGTPTSVLGSISLMRQLTGEAKALAEVEVKPGVFAGPTFTYVP